MVSWFALSTSFTNSHSSALLFIRHSSGSTLYLLVYVDDITVIETSTTIVTYCIATLSRWFFLKDPDNISYFLRVKAHLTTNGLFLSQPKYIGDLLNRVSMATAKLVFIPLPQLKFSKWMMVLRQTLWSLQYLLLTRPNVSLAIIKLSQFMHCPSKLIGLLWNACCTIWLGLLIMVRWFARTFFLLFMPLWMMIRLLTKMIAHPPLLLLSLLVQILYLGALKSQKYIARPFTEAEYYFVASTVIELNWVKNLLQELRFPLSSTLIIYCDSVSATYVCANPVFVRSIPLKHVIY